MAKLRKAPVFFEQLPSRHALSSRIHLAEAPRGAHCSCQKQQGQSAGGQGDEIINNTAPKCIFGLVCLSLLFSTVLGMTYW